MSANDARRAAKKKAKDMQEAYDEYVDAMRSGSGHSGPKRIDPFAPIREKLIGQAMKDEPLDYGVMRDQIVRQYGAAQRGMDADLGRRGLTGSGIDAGLARGAALRQAGQLSQAYQQGLINRRDLQMKLLSMSPLGQSVGGGGGGGNIEAQLALQRYNMLAGGMGQLQQQYEQSKQNTINSIGQIVSNWPSGGGSGRTGTTQQPTQTPGMIPVDTGNGSGTGTSASNGYGGASNPSLVPASITKVPDFQPDVGLGWGDVAAANPQTQTSHHGIHRRGRDNHLGNGANQPFLPGNGPGYVEQDYYGGKV